MTDVPRPEVADPSWGGGLHPVDLNAWERGCLAGMVKRRLDEMKRLPADDPYGIGAAYSEMLEKLAEKLWSAP